MTELALPSLHPDRGAADYWALLRANVPPDVVDPASWDRLAPAASVIPGPAFGIERMLDSPHIIQFGCHVWPWRMEAALASAARFPHAAFLVPHVRAWRSTPQIDGLFLHLMVMWDEPTDNVPPLPQAFLTFAPDHPAWRATVRVFADQLDDPDFAAAWRRCADAPHANVVALGVYLGHRDLPVRVTMATTGQRDWPDHPNWAAVDEIIGLAGVPPTVAVPPTPDPGPTWHVPVIARWHPQPHEALAPLVGALLKRGLVDADTARTLARPPLMIPVPGGATLDGQPALLRLMVSLERIKVVVENGEWVSAKACYMIRPVWRTASRVFIEH